MKTKLTSRDAETINGMKWEIGKTNHALESDFQFPPKLVRVFECSNQSKRRDLDVGDVFIVVLIFGHNNLNPRLKAAQHILAKIHSGKNRRQLTINLRQLSDHVFGVQIFF